MCARLSRWMKMIEHAMFDLQATIHVKRSPQFTMYIHIPSIQITLCKAQPRSIPDNTCSYLFCAKQHSLDVELVARGPKNQDLDVELVTLLEFNKIQEKYEIICCGHVYDWDEASPP